VVSSTSRPHFTPGKDPVPIVQEAGWVPGPVWTGGKSRPHWDSIPDRPARSQSLYRLSYQTHEYCSTLLQSRAISQITLSFSYNSLYLLQRIIVRRFYLPFSNILRIRWTCSTQEVGQKYLYNSMRKTSKIYSIIIPTTAHI